MKEAQNGSVLPHTSRGRWIRNVRLFRIVHAAVAFRKHGKGEAEFSRKDENGKRTSLLKKSYPSVKIIHVQGEDSLASGSDTVPTFISWDSCLSVDEDELTLCSKFGPFDDNNKSNCPRCKTLAVVSAETIENSVNKEIVVPPYLLRQREESTPRSSISSDILSSQPMDIERVIRDRKEKLMKRTTTSDLQSDFCFCCV